MESTADEDLQTSEHRRIVRVGDTVRRPAGWWTPAVQTLLQHLHDVGFPYSPRPGGIDSQGREVVSYIPGESGAIGWYQIHSDQGLRRFASLLREYHDAVKDLRPAPDLEWDFAAPGPCSNDVAYALEYAVPFRDDATARSWHHFAEVPDRRARLEVFADAYGLTSTVGLIDDVLDRQHLTIAHIEELAERGLQPQATWVRDRTLDESRRVATWVEANRDLFTENQVTSDAAPKGHSTTCTR